MQILGLFKTQHYPRAIARIRQPALLDRSACDGRCLLLGLIAGEVLPLLWVDMVELVGPEVAVGECRHEPLHETVDHC